MKAQELKKRLAQGEDVELLDVREREEFEDSGTVPGAKNVPMGRVFLEASQEKLPKEKKIVAICKSGTRCEIVARELKEKGYDIEHLEGGIKAWEEAEQQL